MEREGTAVVVEVGVARAVLVRLVEELDGLLEVLNTHRELIFQHVTRLRVPTIIKRSEKRRKGVEKALEGGKASLTGFLERGHLSLRGPNLHQNDTKITSNIHNVMKK